MHDMEPPRRSNGVRELASDSTRLARTRNPQPGDVACNGDIRIREHTLRAMLLAVDGRRDSALNLLRKASAIEQSVPVEFGPPTSFKPPHEVAGEILTYCVDAGGSITGEHGVGADKRDYMPRMFSDVDLGVMQAVRDAIDPKRLCNPGKVLPTPRLCGEVPGPYRAHPVEQAGIGERF